MRSKTILSRLVHLFTRMDYTHSAIGLDPECMFAITRRDPAHLFPAGLAVEPDYNAKRHVLLFLPTTLGAESRVRGLLDNMYEQREKYKYNIPGILLSLLHIPAKRDGHFVCSEFCAYVLRQTGVYAFHKADNLVRPIDLLDVPGLVPIREVI